MYGCEFLKALRIAIELIIEFRYKLRIMGLPIEGTSQVVCDGKSVVISKPLLTNTVKKKHIAIIYHWVREAVAGSIV